MNLNEEEIPGAMVPHASAAEETRGQTTTAVCSATCPLCHTLDRAVTSESLLAGASWSCARCGQKWTAARLETASAYQRDLAAQRSAST